MKRISFFMLLCISLHSAFGQDMTGIINSNYAGNAGLSLNPASVVGMPFRHEFNLYSQHISVQNNYLYLPAGSNLSGLFNGQSVVHVNTGGNGNASSDKQLNLNAFILGPSYLASHRNSGWAIHTAVRMDLNINDLNINFANLLSDGINSISQQAVSEQAVEFKIDPYTLSMLQWYETGFTYGRTLVESRRKLITAGATLNIDLGSNAAYINSEQMNYHVSVADTLKVYNFSGTYAHTITNDNAGMNDYIGIKGIGGGLNIGAQYCMLREENVVDAVIKNNRRYIFRLGVSLIDIGKVHFFKDTRVNEFKNNSATWSSLSTLKFEGVNEFDHNLNNVFTGSPDGALTNKKLNVVLPAAASVQFDLNFYRNFYLNATWMQRLVVADPQVKRANQLSITARYQSSNFEVDIPYSLYQYYKNRLGIAIRYKWFFIGTDQVASYTGAWNTDGIDAYFGIRLYL
ncbi:MAG: hypothetical protein ABI723_07320 [Bacteroidia bacterium]